MGLRINTNTDALDAYRNLSMTQSKLSDSLSKLSSGYRINKAADDAAGLSISEGLQRQIGGLTQAVNNAQDGINVVQTADGALTEVDSILQRMNDLAVQAANTGSQDTTARQAAQTELDQLNTDLDNIGNQTQFGNSKLLDGTFGLSAGLATGTEVNLSSSGLTNADTFSITLNSTNADGTQHAGTAVAVTLTNAGSGATFANSATGATALQTALQKDIDATALKDKVKATVAVASDGNGLEISFTRASVAGSQDTMKVVAGGSYAGFDATGKTAAVNGVGTGVFQIGAEAGQVQQVNIGAISAKGLATDGIDLVNNASGAITTIEDAITHVSTLRSQLGAYQNGFQHTINNLNVTVENLQSANSSIQDTDMASEMVSFTQQQVLQQAGVSMLAQANSESQSVLKLLQ